MIYLALFIGFLQVGLFTFGGAYASIPLIRDIVIGNGWMSDEMFTYVIAVSESTPGPIIINLATYIGSSQAGFLGALVATTAVVLPSFSIIILLVSLFRNALKNRYVAAFLFGLKPCIIGIIVATGTYMAFENCYTDSVDYTTTVFSIALAIIYGALKLHYKIKISPITLIIISAFVGVVVYGV